MIKKPERKPDNPEQSKRFVETAEEVGADKDEEALERAFKNISARPSRPSQPPNSSRGNRSKDE